MSNLSNISITEQDAKKYQELSEEVVARELLRQSQIVNRSGKSQDTKLSTAATDSAQATQVADTSMSTGVHHLIMPVTSVKLQSLEEAYGQVFNAPDEQQKAQDQLQVAAARAEHAAVALNTVVTFKATLGQHRASKEAVTKEAMSDTINASEQSASEGAKPSSVKKGL